MPRARRIWRAIVVDRSMEPALRAEDRLLVLPAGPGGLPWLRGAPRIGNRVDIGAGAKILGDISIGDDAVIGANAVVLKNVPPGAFAVGVPARVIQREVI